MGTRSRASGQTGRLARSARKAARYALVASGLSDDEAEAWCVAWEAEAGRHHLGHDTRFFWDAGRGWIDAQRAFLNRGRQTVRGRW
jgi:hypothetical protein